MTISYCLVLVTIQGVAERMFTTTLRSQPVYSRSRLSELDPARKSGRINVTDSNIVGDRDTTREDGFPASSAATYLYDATIHPFFFYAYSKWKSLTNVTPGRRHRLR